MRTPQLPRSSSALAAVFLAGACLPAPCYGQEAPPAERLDPPALVALARNYGKTKPAEQMASVQPAGTSEPGENQQDYRARMRHYLDMGKFSALESEVRDARAHKLRFAGGVWKVLAFYEVLGEPVGGESKRAVDYQVQVDRLKRWQAAYPESAAPLIALSEAYFGYAFQARGEGYASTVTQEGWKLYGERLNVSAGYLAEAAKMKDRDPYWYEAMQHLANSQGWPKPMARELMENAGAFEPGYYHYYREYANYLLPKWSGKPGDAEAFAEEISNRLGGKEGKIVYYEIATLLTCQCDSDDSDMENLNWPKIKEGFAALEELYGLSPLKTNRFAHMAVLADDRPAARGAFAKLGENWEPAVWHTTENFQQARAWATRK